MNATGLSTAAGPGGRPSRALAAQITGRIIQAARVLFLQDGYEKTSMDAIAAELGMSKRTLYARFPGKADLFASVVEDVLESHLTALETTDFSGETLRARLLDLTERLLAWALTPEMVALDRVVTAEARTFPKLATLVHDYAVDRITGLVANILEPAGARGGSIPADVRRDATIFLEMMLLPPLRQAVLGMTYENEPSLRQRRLDIFLNGTAA